MRKLLVFVGMGGMGVNGNDGNRWEGWEWMGTMGGDGGWFIGRLPGGRWRRGSMWRRRWCRGWGRKEI